MQSLNVSNPLRIKIRKITVLACTSIYLWLGSLPVQAKPTVGATTHLHDSAHQLKSNNSDQFYQQVRQTLNSALGQPLGDDYYTVYRIIDRLARANQLDESPWRLRITREYEVNAFASEQNVLTFAGGLLDQLQGDYAALACVVGHEMAHHTQSHIPTTVQVAALVEQAEEEAVTQAVAEIEAARQQQASTNSILSFLGGLGGGLLGSFANTTTEVQLGALGIGLLSQALGNATDQERQQAENRAAEIYQEKVAALNAEYSNLLQAQELEADAVGYQYIVRAGFDGSGCKRVMAVLDRLEHSRMPSFSHPRPQDRMARLDQLPGQMPTARLVSQGEANLAKSPKPLQLGLSRDQASLRIESRYGSRDIDDSFPR